MLSFAQEFRWYLAQWAVTFSDADDTRDVAAAKLSLTAVLADFQAMASKVAS